MVSTKDIAWLAGLLEGEASFSLQASAHPRISLAMTDLDICIRAAQILGAECVRTKKNLHGVKQQYQTRLGGRRALEWLMTLYPLMGERRREKFRSIFIHWRLHSTGEQGANGWPNPHRALKKSSTIVWQKIPGALPLWASTAQLTG